jgi:hypothetical protein
MTEVDVMRLASGRSKTAFGKTTDWPAEKGGMAMENVADFATTACIKAPENTTHHRP